MLDLFELHLLVPKRLNSHLGDLSNLYIKFFALVTMLTSKPHLEYIAPISHKNLYPNPMP